MHRVIILKFTDSKTKSKIELRWVEIANIKRDTQEIELIYHGKRMNLNYLMNTEQKLINKPAIAVFMKKNKTEILMKLTNTHLNEAQFKQMKIALSLQLGGQEP